MNVVRAIWQWSVVAIGLGLTAVTVSIFPLDAPGRAILVPLGFSLALVAFEIGIATAKCTQAIGSKAENGVRNAFLSLSTMLQYSKPNKLFNFVHVITGRTAAAGYLSVMTLDPTVHDDGDVNAIAAEFDGLIETRDDGAGRELRVRGLPDAPAGWYEC